MLLLHLPSYPFCWPAYPPTQTTCHEESGRTVRHSTSLRATGHNLTYSEGQGEGAPTLTAHPVTLNRNNMHTDLNTLRHRSEHEHINAF